MANSKKLSKIDSMKMIVKFSITDFNCGYLAGTNSMPPMPDILVKDLSAWHFGFEKGKELMSLAVNLDF